MDNRNTMLSFRFINVVIGVPGLSDFIYDIPVNDFFKGLKTGSSSKD